MEKKIGVNKKIVKTISKSDLEVSFVTTGDIHTFKHGEIFLNQFIGQEIDGSLTNIYLRIFENDEILFFPLMGKESNSQFFIAQSQAKWVGNVHGVNYEVTLKLADYQWFWEVNLEGKDKIVDLVYVNDIGLADESSLRSNEAYNAQYINHQIFRDRGYTIVSRQNQGQSSGYPVLETGAFGMMNITGFLTDGFQFFGKSYKLTRKPEALMKLEFPNEVYQYEMSLLALKTDQTILNGQNKMTFYQDYQANSSVLPTEVRSDKELVETQSKLPEEQMVEVRLAKSKINLNQQINGRVLSNEELRTRFPSAKFEETIDGQILSGFTPENVHFISQSKELYVEREHGEIFLSGNSMSIKNRGLATSSFIYGLFNAHIVIGNTTMNKLLSNQRDHLNLNQASGQRIFVKMGDTYQMLGMPSTFEMGYNFARWIYVLDNDTLTVINFVANKENSLQLEVKSENNQSYDFLILNQVTMDEMEYKSTARLYTDSSVSYTFKAGENSAIQMGNPQLAYRMKFDRSVELLQSKILFTDTTFLEDSLAIFSVNTKCFKLKITGDLDGNLEDTYFLNFDAEKTSYKNYIEQELLNGFKFTSQHQEFEKVNTILPWYAHDMIIHYLSPHGLEQYGGAAWGTRDVAQGPIEFFLSTQHPEIAREILLNIFSHQFEDDGTWPQWFMFDEYQTIYSGESHGDVIVWPFFALGEYLEQTGDFNILKENLPFVERKSKEFTTYKVSLQEHLQKEIDYIKNNFLSDTYLSAYGDGDWDDTLQPANDHLKKSMTSSWTNALTYQALRKYAKVIKNVQPETSEDFEQLALKIKEDFEKYLIVEGIIPGFALQNKEGKFEPIIHPTDTKTNMKYRLLPMNRSIISEIADQKQLEKNLQIIEEKLTFNDGVRLMERSPEYRGGISVNFKRAEQAANFGREIGLLYIHAQIRYVEAMAKIGRSREAWKALGQTIPVGIKEVIENAEPRQANVYFSSSDGNFKTRYEAQANFDKLKSGEVGVKGGWRLYSSGPGIFTNQVITNLAGFKKNADGLLIQPIFPEGVKEFSFDLNTEGERTHIIIRKATDSFVSIDDVPVQTEKHQNIYKKTILKIKEEHLSSLKSGSTLLVQI